MHCTTCITNNNALNAPSTKTKCVVIKYVESFSTLPTGISASEQSQPKSTSVRHLVADGRNRKIKTAFAMPSTWVISRRSHPCPDPD
jgi:hypothetical protein